MCTLLYDGGSVLSRCSSVSCKYILCRQYFADFSWPGLVCEHVKMNGGGMVYHSLLGSWVWWLGSGLAYSEQGMLAFNKQDRRPPRTGEQVFYLGPVLEFKYIKHCNGWIKMRRARLQEVPHILETLFPATDKAISRGCRCSPSCEVVSTRTMLEQ